MTKEDLVKRLEDLDISIAQLNANTQQALANLNALNGAKQECQYWLTKLDEVVHPETEV